MQQFISLIYNVIDTAFDWLSTIYGRYGLTTAIFLAMIFAGALQRYLLRPFIGQSLSDSAANVRQRQKDKK